MGDFDLTYNSELISQKFPPDMSVEPMRYESYQPPLYYLSAVPVYGLIAGFGQADAGEKPADPYGSALTALRLYGVLLAAISLGLLYACAATIFPKRPMLSIGATAFAASLPMHAAMTAAVNNDTLAEVLILAAVLILLRWMRQRLEEARSTRSVGNQKQLLTLGILLGLGLLTKIYVYALFPVCMLMILSASWRTSTVGRLRLAITNVCWAAVPALIIALPMWIRNMWLYGITDPLGLAWHDLVVAGQPTLLDWIAQHGWPAYWARALSFTFRSFWGVFGWLGIFLDERIYTALTIVSAVVAFGLLWGIFKLLFWTNKRKPSEPIVTEYQRWSLLFLGMMLFTVFASYGLYNLKFVQHQGRYLFWGLLPIGLLVAVGWSEVQRVRAGIGASVFVLILTLWLSTDGLIQLNLGQIDKWTLLIGGIVTMFLLLQSLLRAKINDAIILLNNLLPTRFRLSSNLSSYRIDALFSALPFLLLFILSIVTILLTIEPTL